MAVVNGDRYLDNLCRFIDKYAEALLDGNLVLCLFPIGLHYVQARLEAFQELESLRTVAPVDYLRAFIADLGDHRALELLSRVLRLLTAVKVISALPSPSRDPTPLTLLPFGRLKSLELRGCNLSTSAFRGLLELRPILEKLRCHNSADALRHIFAERTVEIQDAQVWSKLSSVSCADNGMLLMDDSLQLLPVVECLDLSRNRFAKVASLNHCIKLKYLDLGFNHLRSISSLSQVKCKITKLILKNNVLVTLDGIQNLINLKDLDLSYNIISDFNEIKMLTSLESLESIWLKGNPITYTAFYREEIFSFFSEPIRVAVDGKKISKTEKWTVGIFISTRQKQDDIYGCYAPPENIALPFSARELQPNQLPLATMEDKTVAARVKRKMSRLASIQDVRSESFTGLDGPEHDVAFGLHGPGSHYGDSEATVTELGDSDGQEGLDLMKKAESIEKQGVASQELKVQMESKILSSIRNRKQRRQKRTWNEELAGLSQGIQEEEEIEEVQEDSETESSVGENTGIDGERAFDPSRVAFSASYNPSLEFTKLSLEGAHRINMEDQIQTTGKGYRYMTNEEQIPVDESLRSFEAIDRVEEPRTVSAYLTSPPHYQEDMLHKRQNFEEELLRLPFDSGCTSSSDSDTSDDGASVDDSSSCSDNIPRRYVEWRTKRNEDGEVLMTSEVNKVQLIDSPREEPNTHSATSGSADEEAEHYTLEEKVPEALTTGHLDLPESADVGGSSQVDSPPFPYTSIRTDKKGKTVRRVVSLNNTDLLQLKESRTGFEADVSNFQEQGLDTPEQQCHGVEQLSNSRPFANGEGDSTRQFEVSDSPRVAVNGTVHDPLKEFFRRNIGIREKSESCLFYVQSGCIRLWEEHPEERNIYLLKSSENKVYMVEEKKQLSTDTVFRVQASHNLQDVKRVIVGLGLQALRVDFGVSASYLFMTRDAKITQDIIDMMRTHLKGDSDNKSSCQVLSWEHIQVNMFEKYVVGGAKPNIRMYLMLYLSNRSPTGEVDLAPCSLVLTSSHIYLCVERIAHFGEASDCLALKDPYFLVMSWARISDLFKLVYKSRKENKLVLMFEEGASSMRKPNTIGDGSPMWDLIGISKDSITKLIALLRAGFLEATSNFLPLENSP